VREVHRHRRRQALRRLWIREVAELPEPADERPDSDPALRRRIAAALERLSRSQREAFVLVHLQGLTVDQTAEVLGKASGTVKSHLHRALHALRSELADLHAGKRRPLKGDDT
jgi:RNA polymerase sigma factor (sigma-70 family)